MPDKDFGRKPKFGPVSKKGPPKPPPKNRNPTGWISLRAIQPAGPQNVGAGFKPARARDGNSGTPRPLGTSGRAVTNRLKSKEEKGMVLGILKIMKSKR